MVKRYDVSLNLQTFPFVLRAPVTGPRLDPQHRGPLRLLGALGESERSLLGLGNHPDCCQWFTHQLGVVVLGTHLKVPEHEVGAGMGCASMARETP